MQKINDTWHPTVTDTEIRGFFGAYRFLSNFHSSRFRFDAIWYESSEAAYMAQKTEDIKLRKIIATSTAGRDNGFLFYLLGKVARRQHEQDTAKKVGQWVAYALLRGDALEDALTFGRAADLYDSAIFRLALRIADAMRFLTKNKKATGLHGRAITTMMDIFSMGRSYNFTPLLVEQNIESFGTNEKGC